MKTIFCISLGLLLSFGSAALLEAQSVSGQTAQTTTLPPPTPYAVVGKDANSSVWEQTAYEVDPSGNVVQKKHSYTEVATGLHYLQNGQWLDSKEEIDIQPNGTASATQGQHQAYFPGNIYQGQIELVTPDGLQLQSRPLALSYDDGTNTVIIAELTNSIGQVLGANQVIYTNAFTGFVADLIYTYTKSGFEQDIVLQEQPPTPESLGLNPETAKLEILTEFFSPPQPNIQSTVLPPQAGLSLTDQSLGFGTMQMIPGRAFLLGENATDAGAKVAKQWLLLDGRQFLVEEVPVNAILAGLAALPLPAVQPSSNVAAPTVSKLLKLPQQRLVKTTPKTLPMARASISAKGFVLDYIAINSGQTNYTFQGDTTYYISGTVNLSGTNTFEGGAVIKYTNNAALNLNYPAQINCLATAYRPVIFTAKDDNSVGETLSVSTGNPTNYYASPALTLGGTGSSTYSISYFRIAWARQAINSTYATVNLYHSQLVNCLNGISLQYDGANLRNILFANVQTNCILNDAGFNVQNTTVSGSACLAICGTAGGIELTNCILANVTQLTNSGFSAGLSGGNNGFYNSPSFGASQVTNTFYPFRKIGGGSYYLTNGCAFTNAGTATIDSILLASLSQKTTHPPMVYSNVTITTNLTLYPQTPRDTNATPDLGYHYDPLDYAFGGCDLYTNLSFTPGTVAGWFEVTGSVSSSGQPYGISLNSGANLTTTGTATQPCWIVEAKTVQEGNGNWTGMGWMGGIMVNGGAVLPQLNGKFTKWADSTTENHFRDNWADGVGSFADCEFYSGSIGAYDQYSLTFSNCLFFRTAIYGYGYQQTRALNTTIQNCTFYNGFMTLNRYAGQATTLWTIKNTTFDGTGFSFTDNLSSTNTAFDFNAYNTNNLSGLSYPFPYTPVPTNVLEYIGAHDLLGGNYNWQSSWLGNFYLPSGSSLIDKGNTNANLLGLYHFTTQTNQTVEANSIVDIGYHYVATDNNGNPLDSNGDGIPDYLEDANGNGIVDNGETNWGLAILVQPVSQTVSQGVNVTNSVTAAGVAPVIYQWYFNGTSVAGANSSSLILPNIQVTNEGTYFVVVTNFTGSLTSSAATIALTCDTSPSGLVGWWEAESNALDSAGVDNGTLSTNGVTYTAGKIGLAFNFDGTNGFIQIPDAPDLDQTNLTIEAWVRFSSLNSQRYGTYGGGPPAGEQFIFEKPNTQVNPYSDGLVLYKIRSGSVDNFKFAVTSSNGTAVTVGSTLSIQTNVWYHVAGVRGSNYIQLYVNGQPTSPATVSFAQNYSNQPFFIGSSGEPSYWDARFEGSLDESSLYNRALSSNEIAAIYMAGTNGYGKCQMPPVIITQPISQLATVGRTVTLIVGATGSQLLNYQWCYNGTNFLAGATNATLILPNVQTTNSGYYSVTVSNAEGVATSTIASLDVETCFSSLDVAMVFDHSGSMSNTISGGMQKLQAARVAATNFLNNLNFTSDQAALFSFSDTVTTNQTLTNNLTLLLQGVGSISNAGGDTYMSPALQAAQTELTSPRHNPAALPVMVFLSDGEPTDNSNVVLSAATQVKSAGTRLITIALGTDADTNFMSQMASSTNDFYYANSVSQLTNVYSLIAASVCRGGSGPTVSLTSPTNGQTLLARTNFTISATATNPTPGVSISWVQFFSNGTNSIGYAVAPTNGLYQISWTPPAGGSNVLTARAVDSLGSNALSSPVTVYVRSLPSVTIVSPTNGQPISLVSPMSATNITISAIAVADRATITNVSFYQGTNYLGRGTLVSSNASFTWTSVTNGTYTLSAQAADSTDVSGVSFPVQITVNPTNLPPRVYPGANQTIYLSTNAVQLTGLVTDDGLPVGGTLSTLWTNLNGGTNVTIVNSNLPVTSAYFWATGTYVLRLSANDSQYTTTSNVTFTVLPANQPPYVYPGTNQTTVLPATNSIPVATLTPTLIPAQLQTPIGVDYFVPSNCVIASVNYSSGNPYNFELVSFSGATNQFSSISNLSDEVYISTVRNTIGGFKVGEMFCGNGQPGEIMRIEPDGTTIGTNVWTNSIGVVQSNAWVILPSMMLSNGVTVVPGLLRGGLWVDRTGVWGGDLIVTTTYGNNDSSSVGYVWRVNSSGQATFVAQMNPVIDDTFEGVTTCPNNVQNYGPWAGKILVGGDSAGDFFAVDTNGFVANYQFPFGAEDIRIIPQNENFFGCDGLGGMWGISANQFLGMYGDILIAQEGSYTTPAALYRVHWNGSTFDAYRIDVGGNGSQWEGINFVPAGLLNLTPAGVQLNGLVHDDGELFAPTSNAWTVVSGPGPVTFGDSTQTNTTAEFSVPGDYVLQLSAYDGQYTTSSNVTIHVLQNQAPTVSAGTNQVVTNFLYTTLTGSVSDDGLPLGETNITWSIVSPGSYGVTFGSPNQAVTTVSVPDPGTYIFALTADDGQATNSAEVTVAFESATITLSPGYGIATRTNTPFTITARLMDAYNHPATNNTEVDFSLNGGTSLGSAMTYSNGYAIFTYTNVSIFAAGRDTITASSSDFPGVSAVIYKDWGQDIGCGDEKGPVGSSGPLSREWPADQDHYADYYVYTATAGNPINLALVQDYSPLVIFVRDPSDNLVVTSSVNFGKKYDINTLNYTPLTNGDYVIEVTTIDGDGSPGYDLYLSCSNGPAVSPQMQVLFNGTNIPSGGTVIFPETAQGAVTNVTLTVTNSGNVPFEITGFGTNGNFTLTNSILGTTMAVAGYTNLGINFNAISNGLSLGTLVLQTNFATGSNYIVYLMGNTFPTGALPAIQITAPASGSTFFDDEYVSYTALVTPGSVGISSVYLGVLSTNGIANQSPAMSQNGSYYTNTYPALNGDFIDGDNTVLATVTDLNNQSATAQPVLIHIIPRTSPVPTESPQIQVLFNNTNIPSGGTIVLPQTVQGLATSVTVVITNAGNYPLGIQNVETNGDFTLTNDVSNSIIMPGASTNLGIVFNASLSGQATGELLLGNNSSSGGPYVVNLVGNAFPPGYGTPPANGLPPVAVNDQFHVPANSINNILYPLANDSDTNGYPLTIIATTPSEGGTVTIINNGTAISYTPPFGIRSYTNNGVSYPADGFSYTISDGHGGTASAVVSIIIDASDVPQVTLTASNSSVTAGTLDPITASNTPPQNIVKVDFYLGQDLIGEVTNGINGVFTLNWIASYDSISGGIITASATDKFGQVGVAQPITVNVTPPTGGGQIIANLDHIADSTGTNALSTTNLTTIRDGIMNLYGQAYHSLGSNVTWQLGVYTIDGTFVRNLTPATTGTVGSPTATNFLEACDLSTLMNGVYDLRLTVTGGYISADTSVQFRLESNLKIGQFSFSQQDLVIPVNGIPLTVTRTYNSINPEKGDFGYGWTYALSDLNASIDETRQNVTDLDGETFSQRSGGSWDVTLTLPNGQRTTFYFNLSQQGTLGAYAAQWLPAPGITATLTLPPRVPNTLETLVGSVVNNDSLFYWDASPGTPMNNYDFPGFILTTQDGTQYTVSRQDLGEHFIDDGGEGYYVQAYGDCYLSKITERSLDTIAITPNSIVYTATNGATREIVFQRNADNLITSITDPNGLSSGPPAVQYQYDSNDNLINVLNLVNRSIGAYVTNSFSYTNVNFPHYITGIVNANGTQVAENFYDSSGKLTAVRDADGNLTQFIHNLTNNMEVVIDRRGYTNTFVYDPRGNVIAQTNQLGQITQMAYDINNNKTNEVILLNGQPYATNSYAYNTNLNLMVSSTDPLGHTSTFQYDMFGNLTNSTDANGHSTTNYYDGSGNLVATSDALGDTTVNFYNGSFMLGSQDAIGTVTTNYYDPATGYLVGTATLAASGAILSSNTFAYDANGNRTNSTVWRQVNGSPAGAATAYIYDAMNRVVQTIDADGGTNTVVYNAIGKQQSTIDPLGNTNTYTYDDQGRLVQTTYPDITTESSAYDANGNRSSSTDRAERKTTYVYDALNRLTQTIYPDGTTNMTVYDSVGRVAQTVDARGTITAFGYDAAGRRLAVTNAIGTSVANTNFYSYDANGNQLTFTDPLGHTTTNVFDILNRQVQTLYSDGTTNSTGYDADGRRVAATNQDGVVTLFGYDGAGRLIAVTNALNQVTRYQYDAAGNEIAQIDARNRTNTFAYDGMGRRIAHTRPDNQSEWFAFDAAGNLIDTTNFNSQIIANQYDALNRLTNTTDNSTFNYSYNYTATGQRQNMVNNHSYGTAIGYAYDSRDRLTQKAETWSGGLMASLNYRYDADGNVTNIQSGWANGVNLAYGYDALNRLTNVLARGQLAAAYGYDGAGNLQGMRYGNGVTNLYQYDSLNRLTNLVWNYNGSARGSFAYQLKRGGTRTNLAEVVNGTSRSYAWSYDNLYRLTNEVINGQSAGYGYDAVGNRTNRNSSITGLPTDSYYSYDTNDELTAEANTGSYGNYSYDNDGNTTGVPGAGGGPTYGYDGLNRLTSATVGGVSLSYTYDGDGDRNSKTIGTVTTYYLVDDRNPSGYAQVLEEYQTGNYYYSPALLSRVYNYGLNLISQQQFNTNTLLPGTTSYYGFDGHGSVRFLTDTNGSITDTYAYDAYGTIIAQTYVGSPTLNNYLYCGQQYDPDLGLYYNRARYLNPNTGRFWSMDSYAGSQEDPLSLHKYLYAADDPVDYDDPSGNDYGDFDINISSILQPLANVLLASAGTPGGMSLQQLGAFAPKFPVVVVTMPNGTQYLPETKVKDSDQQNIVGAAIGTPIYIAVPQGVVPQELVDTWTYNKKGKRETGQSIDAFLDFWRPGGPHDYKSLNPPSSEIYDAFGNFEFGASAYPAGFTLEQILWWGDRAHPSGQHWFGENNPINSADITSGYNATKNGGKLSTEQRSILP